MLMRQFSSSSWLAHHIFNRLRYFPGGDAAGGLRLASTNSNFALRGDSRIKAGEGGEFTGSPTALPSPLPPCVRQDKAG